MERSIRFTGSPPQGRYPIGLTASPQDEWGLHMHVCHAREQHFRWLLVTKDLSPHTIRAYETCTGCGGERERR
jgi:hypothetical protein